jgi:2-oxoisovalerate dehydrogenase E2 component (dihydrolipoyl transacylase)
MSTFNLPDLGEGLLDAEIVAWHVSEGDHVVADEPLLSVETDKAVVEVPSPRSGYVKRLLSKPHDRVKVGAPIVEFDEAPHADSGTVVGHLDVAPEAAHAVQSKLVKPVLPPGQISASPAVRALARQRSIDLTRVAGTGPNGMITRADLDSAVGQKASGTAVASPLIGVRRSMAINMAKSHAEVVPATVWDEADIGSWTEHNDVTVRLVRAVAAGCKAEPILNSWYDSHAMTIQIFDHIDLGLAVDFEGGLIVPIIRNADKQEPTVLRAEVDRLKTAARDRSIATADLRNPTITLSNYGMLAGLQATLVVLPPQVAIIGAGRIFRDTGLRENGFIITRILPLSLTFDHRVATGGEAGRFLKAMIDDLQKSG